MRKKLNYTSWMTNQSHDQHSKIKHWLWNALRVLQMNTSKMNGFLCTELNAFSAISVNFYYYSAIFMSVIEMRWHSLAFNTKTVWVHWLPRTHWHLEHRVSRIWITHKQVGVYECVCQIEPTTKHAHNYI